jgi:glycosyltransferase involved in cell wall biosynthesis
MRVLLDLQALVGHARDRGLGRYSLAFAEALARRPEVTEAVALLPGGAGPAPLAEVRAMLAKRLPSVRVVSFDAPWPWLGDDAGSVAAHLRAERVRDQLVRELHPDVVLVCSLFELPITSVVSIEEARPFTATIGYDLLPSTDPACAWPVPWRDVYEHRMASLVRSDLILAISDHAGSEFRAFLGDACPPIRTIWGAPGDLALDPDHDPVPLAERRGVVCAGGADPRKNQVATLRAFAALPADVRDRHPLTIQGNRSTDESRAMLRAAEELGVAAGQVDVLGANLTETDLRELLRRARLVTMPSLGEGLGLPVLEAWALGTPAIASSTTSLGEVVGDHRWTFAPTDDDAQSRLLRVLLTDDGAWADAAEHGAQRAAFFTWERTAQRAVAAILDHHPSLTPGPAVAAPGGATPDPTAPTLAWVSAGGPHPEPLLGHLARRYRLTAVDDAQELEGFDRVLFDVAPGPNLPGVIDAMERVPGVAVLGDPDATWAEISAVLPAGARAQLGYGAGGIRGIAGPAPAGLLEILRATLGVVLLDPDAHQEVSGPPLGLPPRWVATSRWSGPDEIHGWIEGWYRAAPGPLGADSALDGTLTSMLRNRPDRAGWTLYCDVTRPREHPGRSGIQRVTAALARNLVQVNAGRTFLVALEDGGLVHDLTLLEEFAGVSPAAGLNGGHVVAQPGDVLLVTEINPESAQWHPVLGEWRARGGIVVQVVYDLLPIRFEDFFPFAKGWFTEWLGVFTRYADVLVCDSEAAARDLRVWLADNPSKRPSPPLVTWMRLGYDLTPVGAAPAVAAPQRDSGRTPRVLMVGTVEPRKGVEVMLDAAEAIWAAGHQVQFVLVGRPGWAMPSLLGRLEEVADAGGGLTWLRDASDEDLTREYERADLLIMPSRGEGFGLPIVEALAHGVPVIARDIPVFRELLGDTDSYFGRDADLADAILRRLADPSPAAFAPGRLVTWRETAQELLGIVAQASAGRVGRRD